MDYILIVDVAHSWQDTSHYFGSIDVWEFPIGFYVLLQTAALDELHTHVEFPVNLYQMLDSNYVGVVQLVKQLSFLHC